MLKKKFYHSLMLYLKVKSFCIFVFLIPCKPPRLNGHNAPPSISFSHKHNIVKGYKSIVRAGLLQI